MALDRFGAEVFLLLKQRGVSLDNVLTFGRQHFAIHPLEFSEIPGLAGVAGDDPALAGDGERFAEPFFHRLGAKTADSLDASDYQSCSRIHDLNEPIPESWHAAYEVVFDGGTLEHVFHFPNAVANAMNLVKPGGVLVTQSPSNNLNGHGFYQFSPELFFRLFNRANGFRILLAAFVETDWPHRVCRVDDPEAIGRRVTFGGRGPLQLITIARRETLEPPLTSPAYQSDYSASWTRSAETDPSTPASSTPSVSGSFKHRLRRLLPAGWLRRYQQTRREQRRRELSTVGVTRVESLDACFRDGEGGAPPASRKEVELRSDPVS